MFKKFSFILIAFLLLTFNAFGSGLVDNDINTNTNTTTVLVPVVNTNTNLNANTNLNSNHNDNMNLNSNKNTNTNLNTNLNNNVNRNDNTNLQGQVQGQGQDQDQIQGQGQLQGQGQDQSIYFAPVTEREFVNPAQVNFPGLTTMGVDPGLSVNYQPYAEILMFKKIYSESELRQMAEGHGFQRSPFIRTHKFGPPGEFSADAERTVTFIVAKEEFPVNAKFRQVLSFIGAAESKKGYSEELLGRAGLEIIAAGGNYGYLLNQGYKRHSKGRTLSFFIGGTGAQMGDNGDKSQSLTPGVAGSGGSSQLPEFPWLRVTGLYVQ